MGPRPGYSLRCGMRDALLLLLLWLPIAAAASEPVRHTVTVDGHELAVWSKSPAVPRAVMLLVHGRTWSARPDFDLQVPGEDLSLMDGLVAAGIASYAVDLRGYGASPRDASGWLTPERAAADVGAVAGWVAGRHPGLPKPWLFGWSYGAMITQLVAQSAPERLAGAVLFGYPVRPGVDVSPDTAGDPPRVPTTRAAALADFILPGSISEAAQAAFADAALAADPVRADWRALEQWRRLDAQAVRVPVLLLQAGSDPLARADVHSELFNRLGTMDKAWVVIPGGDHAAFLETPRPYFLTTVAGFVFRGR